MAWFSKRQMSLSLVLLLASACATSAEFAVRADVWEVQFGTPATQIDARFTAYACGTNGGPPSIPLSGFQDFASCPAEAGGLHEVYFRYDEYLENVARALERPRDVRRYGGTTSFDFPVIASFLFDAVGNLQGKRLVTDPRPENRTARARQEFWTLGNLLQAKFSSRWDCRSLEGASREHAIGDYLISRTCSMTERGLSYVVQQRYLQTAGQTFVNPQTGRIEPDAFYSETRFEIFDSAWARAGM